jgi:hypothetical protein
MSSQRFGEIEGIIQCRKNHQNRRSAFRGGGAIKDTGDQSGRNVVVSLYEMHDALASRRGGCVAGFPLAHGLVLLSKCPHCDTLSRAAGPQ